MKTLSKEKILEIIKSSDCISRCIVNLYSVVIDHKWEDILSFNSWPQVNSKTGMFIVDEMQKKWDPVTVNMQWLNKGFSSFHDELKDWKVLVPDDCYTLIGPEGKHVSDINDFTAGFAKVEVEELGVDPDEFRKDAELEYDDTH